MTNKASKAMDEISANFLSRCATNNRYSTTEINVNFETTNKAFKKMVGLSITFC